MNRHEGIMREWRIIDALDGTDVPHTPAIAMCGDAAVAFTERMPVWRDR